MLAPHEPVFVRRVFDQEPVVIPRTIFPPCRAALAQSHFGSVNRLPGKGKPAQVFSSVCSSNGATGVHEFFGKCFPRLTVETRVCRAPESTADDYVASVWSQERIVRHCVFVCGALRKANRRVALLRASG